MTDSDNHEEPLAGLLPVFISDQVDTEARDLYKQFVYDELHDRLADAHRLTVAEMASVFLQRYFESEEEDQQMMVLRLSLALLHKVYDDVQKILDGADGKYV